jgi:hypothetical protein
VLASPFAAKTKITASLSNSHGHYCGLKTVIASEAKQSMPQGRMDCFVARAPRNDEGHGFICQTARTVIANSRSSLRAKRSNPCHKERMDCFVARAPRNDEGCGFTFKQPGRSLRTQDRHCERSEAIHAARKEWIASSHPPSPEGGLRRTRELLATTTEHGLHWRQRNSLITMPYLKPPAAAFVPPAAWGCRRCRCAPSAPVCPACGRRARRTRRPRR